MAHTAFTSISAIQAGKFEPMSILQDAKTKQRVLVYGGLGVVLIFGRFLIQNVSWVGTIHLFTLMEMIATIFAVFIGILTLVRFYTKRNITLLFIGTGFIGVAFLDGYHAVITGPFFNYIFLPVTTTQFSWRWNPANIFLALLIATSWLIGRREEQQQDRSRNRRFYEGLSLLSLVVALFFGVVPVYTQFNIPYRAVQAEVILSTPALLLALGGYLYKGQWRTDPFENWLVVSLIFNLGGQVLFATSSNQLFDVPFLAAETLKLVSYLCVLTGLLISMYATFKQSEQTAAELIQANEALQYEIAERKRVETAEHEQRELAEALREVGVALNGTLDFDVLLDVLLDQTARVLPYDTANVMLVIEQNIRIVCTRGYERPDQISLPREFPLTAVPSLQQMRDTKQPLIIPDTAVHEAWVRGDVSPHVRSWAGAPIVTQGEVIAFLALNNSHPNFYQADAAIRLNAFASQAAIAFHNARLYEALQKRVEELTALNRISQAINATLDLQKALTIITEEITRVMGVAATSVVLHDAEKDDLWFAAASGQASDFVLGKRLQVGQGIIGWVAQHGQPALVPNVASDKRYFKEFDQQSGFTACSILCVPLMSRGQTIGAVEALNKEVGTFTVEDLQFLTLLTGPAATALENAQLYERAQQEILERRRAEEELEAERALLTRRVEERTADLSAANAELARAARLKDEFLASMSHELRTPLNAILGMSEALQEQVYGPLNENQTGSLRSIEESGRHLLSLINDILDVSKIEAGKLELEIAPLSVESVCLASLRLIRQDAQKKRLRVASSFDSSVTTLLADERRLKQMLVNLLSNAVKFTAEGGEIGLEVCGDTEHEVVHFTVRDTGIGIAAKDMARLFRPFVQLDSSLSRQYPGTGLGLSLVYRMAELHGGSVTVESAVGKGSRFTISLPWQDEIEAPLTEIMEFDETEVGLHLSTIRRVLLIDDSPTTTAQLTRYLGELGVGTVVYNQGTGAINYVLKMKPDVVILDVLLPGASGWEILEGLKKEPLTQNIPVLIISVVDNREQALTLGAADCLIKPISRQQLQRALHRLLMRQIQSQHAMILAADQDVAEQKLPLVLLAEDNEANIQTISNYLIAKGCRVMVVRNGREAIERVKEDTPDIILMDIQMPNMDGLTAIRHIREELHQITIPIVALTALAMPEDRQKCLEAGANAYMSKPVSLKALMETIESLLQKNQSI